MACTVGGFMVWVKKKSDRIGYVIPIPEKQKEIIENTKW
jgi:hypothetical protein